jgi:predicted nuclease of predicted toxin-antitoxin system
MKFLVDNALSPKIAQYLRDSGYDAIHLREYDMQSASDSEVFSFAETNTRTIISSDTDFGALLAVRNKRSPSFILFRKTKGLHPDTLGSHLLRLIEEYTMFLEQGCILTVTDEKIRLRKLPID